MVGISQAESNNIKACALPSIHLPLTREASLARGEAMDVLLRRLWEWRGSMQREGQERQGCLKRVCPRALSTDAYKWSQKVGLQGCIKSVTLNRCTMQRHKWLSLQDAATLMADEAVTHRPQTTTIAMDAKPTKHTQALALRKARGIVRFWKVWCKRRMVVRGNNPHRHGSE